jgi:ribosomal protein S18 acetylase RimI-like enzyme
MEVTDMILDVGQLAINHDLPAITLMPQTPETRTAILRFVAAEYPQFSQYYESPRAGTSIYAVMHKGQMVGAVLIEKKPRAAESSTDGAIACLVTAEDLRRQGIGSAAIVACCMELREQGFIRVIAEWVASVELYRRLGFRIWKTREISLE